jgi:thiol:disulfide interchange protein DsbG
MRDLLSFVLIGGWLAFAASPALTGEAPHCALDAPSALIKVPNQSAAGDSSDIAGLKDTAAAAPLEKGVAGGVLAAPEGAERIPVLKHIAGTGAKLLDLGSAHGLKSVVARNGEQFMVLQIAPDGDAVVSGPKMDISVSTLLTIAGNQVTELGEKHGLRGFYLRNGQEFQVLYATPDGQATIAGVMWDSSGKNLTREQVAPIAGALPTVVVGKDGVGSTAETQAATKPGLEAVEKTAFGVMGVAGAPRLWLFVDPLCSYSVRALRELKPFVDQGRVQLAIIPVSVLDYEDQNQSTPAALALLSKDPAAMAAAWEHREYRGAPAPEAAERLRINMAAAQDIGLRGTPTVVWRKADGTEGRIDGLPNDWGASVISSLGGENHVAASR